MSWAFVTAAEKRQQDGKHRQFCLQHQLISSLYSVCPDIWGQSKNTATVEYARRIHSEHFYSDPKYPEISEVQVVLRGIYFPALDDQDNFMLQQGDILERVAVHDHHVGQLAFGHRAQVFFHPL